MSAIISVEHLGKQYRIGALRRGNSFRDAFDEKIRSLLSRKKPSESKDEVLWALKDVSFQLEAGEVLGIIGRNGAGKSTLLKILSRITGPTEGLIRIGGRVAALLEVGTGFSGELTGRENIFLNGSILGMKRAEILSKFDEIVAFAEMERFIDTPVKRYSSGMYMRLAFAIAAHLDPEILIVDEVLAVGDAAFQRKCLGKMQRVARAEGRTVLFVSHNMAAVQTLCRRALHFAAGRIVAEGDVDRVVKGYLAPAAPSAGSSLREPVELGPALRLDGIDLPAEPVTSGGPLRLALRFSARAATAVAELAVLFYSAEEARVAVLDLRPGGLPANLPAGGGWTASCAVPSLPFVEGEYSVGLYVRADRFADNRFNLARFVVAPRPAAGGLAPYGAEHRGLVELDFTATFQAGSGGPASGAPSDSRAATV